MQNNLTKSELKNKIENLGNPNLEISDVQVKDPNNPANLIDGKLIVFRIAN